MKKKYLILCIFAQLFTGCQYLDTEFSEGTEEDVAYGYISNVQALINAAYTSLPTDYGVISGAMMEAASDNMIYTWDTNAIYSIYDGTWSPTNTVVADWSKYYAAIRDINDFLAKYDAEELERFQYDEYYKEDIALVKNGVYEVRALRALYYFELVKRYGDVPLLTETISIDDAANVSRTPATEVFAFIEKECDAVKDFLPSDYTDFPYSQTGRINKGAVLALKARAMLYAASPLFAGEQNAEALYLKAAKAAAEVINLTDANGAPRYSLENIDVDPLFTKTGNDVLLSKQLIFEYRGAKAANSFEKANAPFGFENATGGNTPTQNLVDAFEFATGEAFDWSNPEHVANIYTNRDPRFYKKIVNNGSMFMGIAINTANGATHRPDVDGATKTGYYLRALLDETLNISSSVNSSSCHHFPGYRYAEVLLNYAEALYGYKGDATYTDATFAMSALDAVNEVRAAANMPAITADNFGEKVKNERRVELAFEGHRFWDIRRWKIAGDAEVNTIYGVNISGSSVERVQVQKRAWADKMYLFPLSQAELSKTSLTQTPGWEL